MVLSHLKHSEVGLPNHLDGISIHPSSHDMSLFDLSSHAQAKKALEFGLKLHREGFHIFVIGEERSGRVSATMAMLRNYSSRFPSPKDWVYLNNFNAPQRPLAFAMPAGMGSKLKGHMAAMISTLQSTLVKHLDSKESNHILQQASRTLEDEFSIKVEQLRKKANDKGFDILKNQEGQFFIIPHEEEEVKKRKTKKEEEDKTADKIESVRGIQDELTRIGQEAQHASEKFLHDMRSDRSAMARKLIVPFCKDLLSKFHEVAGFLDWVEQLQRDLCQNFELFLTMNEQGQRELVDEFVHRYRVNVLVDHSGHHHAPIVTVAHPSYENLFGSIKYRAGGDGFETDFTLIQPGALHKANGGILVLHADALAQQQDVWDFLKRALRDHEIRVEELHRQNGMPMILAPNPQPVPLQVQVVLIGAPWWFDDFFSADPEFRSYFKVRAEIDLSMPATHQNKVVYAQLINQWANNHLDKTCDRSAIQMLLGHSSRWASHRNRLSARFELIGDMLREANIFAEERGSREISSEDLQRVYQERRERKSTQFTQHVEEILEGRLVIQTTGAEIGQVNALTVLTSVDYVYGIPARVTARTYAAKDGVVSIERSIEMSGSIQDKGVMIITGYLNGLLGQKQPLSFGCSITFEQLYMPIDGDSASVAELVAILSSLADLPVQQNIAVTGAIDQHGQIQAVGGIHQKVEGFYEVCKARGFTGNQGVIIPESNRFDLVMWDDITRSVEKGEFHIWTANTLADVMPLLLNAPLKSTVKGRKGQPDESVEGRALKRLSAYTKLLKNE